MLLNATVFIVCIGLGILALLIGLFVGFVPCGLWFKALLSGTHIFGVKLIGMKLRKVDSDLLVDCYINARKAGVKITIDDIETHYLAGGNVKRVVDALIMAHNAKIQLTIANAMAIDLANRDIVSAVQNCVTPVVITTPEISAVAIDGIEIKIKVRITVRNNIQNLIGGAGEDTVIARVGEGVVSAIGSAKCHKSVLENPDKVSESVMQRNLDKGTAFEIISIDIADIEVGRNIGAELMAQRAETEMQIANAKAEERRANAIAMEQEMRARTEEMRAKKLSAESIIPKAISIAFQEGHIGVMDYYRLKNMQADTGMRESISSGGTTE